MKVFKYDLQSLVNNLKIVDSKLIVLHSTSQEDNVIAHRQSADESKHAESNAYKL
jgi:hypothetical protein